MRVLAGIFILASCGSSWERHNDQAERSEALKTIRAALEGTAAEEDTSIRVNTTEVDLNDDGYRDVLAYVHGETLCGTGGCNLFILQAKKGTYELITELTITWPPIRVLESKSNGWQDIAVWVQGGGIQPGYEARLRFDGKTYPSNPSLVAAEKGVPARGKIVIDRSSAATPLNW